MGLQLHEEAEQQAAASQPAGVEVEDKRTSLNTHDQVSLYLFPIKVYKSYYKF